MQRGVITHGGWWRRWRAAERLVTWRTGKSVYGEKMSTKEVFACAVFGQGEDARQHRKLCLLVSRFHVAVGSGRSAIVVLASF